MEDFYTGEISDFSYMATGTPWLQNETVSCWPAQGPDGDRGLLWRIYLTQELLEQAWSLPAGSHLNDRQIDHLVMAEMEKQQQWSQEHPNLLLDIKEIRVQPYLMDPTLRELHILTGYAQPLRHAFPAGLSQETEVIRLGLDLCRICRSAGAAGYLPASLCPDNLLLGPEGNLLLVPLWPGAAEQRPEGFFMDGARAERQAYSAAMLLFWLLNRGETPFVQEAARLQDAERRRLSGESLPAVVGMSAELGELLGRVCRLPAGRDCSLDVLESGLRALKRPKQQVEQLEKEREEQRLRQQQEQAEQQRQQEQDEQQLRRARKKRQKDANRSLGSDAGDRRLLILLIVGLAAAVAVTCLVLGMRAISRLQGSMNAGNYATALEQIERSYGKGENVDELVEVYAEQCLQNEDYIRAMAAYDYWSGTTAPDADQVRAVVELTIQSGEPRRAEKFLNQLAQLDGPCAELAGQIQQEYSEELAT